MRDIKFEFLYRGMPYSSQNQERPWFKKVYSIDDIIVNGLANLSDVHKTSELVAKRQYTGLKDKNGVEIYEGDIVRDHNGVCEVQYSEIKAAFKVNYHDGFAKWFIDYNLSGERESIEVIGNIYQNPELLAK